MDIYNSIVSSEGDAFPEDEFIENGRLLVVDWRDAAKDIIRAFLDMVGKPDDELFEDLDESSNEIVFTKDEHVVRLKQGAGVSEQHSALLALQTFYGHEHAIRYLHGVADGDTACFAVEAPDRWEALERENPFVRGFFVPINDVPDVFETPGDQLDAAARRYQSAG